MSLLALPWEIRSIILTELLVLPIPIQSHHNIRWLDTSLPPHSGASQPGWDLWTPSQRPPGQILRVCRQLHDEGVPILYRLNTFSIVLLLGTPVLDTSQPTMYFLNHSSLPTAFAAHPHLKLTTKFAVSLHFDSAAIHHIWSRGRTFAPVATLVGQMRRLLPPRLDALHLNFHWANPVFDAPWHLPKFAFYHLRHLRARACRVEGVDEGVGELYARVIASELPPVDLEEDYRALRRECCADERLIRRWLENQEALWAAVCEFDVDGFRTTREVVLAGARGRGAARKFRITDVRVTDDERAPDVTWDARGYS